MVLRRTMGCLCWLVASCHVASNLHAWGAPALPNHSVSALSLAAGSGSASRHSCIDTGCRPPAHRSASMCASTVGRATYTDELPVSVGGEGGHCGGAGLAKPPTQGLQCRAPPSAASGPSSGGEIARGPLTPWQSMVLGRRVGPTARWLAVLVRTLLGLLAGPTKPRSCPTSTPTSRALSKATFRTSGSGTTAANDAPSAALGCQHVSGPTPLASHRSVLPLERPQPLGPPPRPKACPHLTKSKAAGCGLCVTSRQRLAFFGVKHSSGQSQPLCTTTT